MPRSSATSHPESYKVVGYYFDSSQLDFIIETLKSHQIHYRLTERTKSISPEVITGTVFEPNLQLEVLRSEFEKARKIFWFDLDTYYKDVDLDSHYLASLDDDALFNIIEHPDQYNLDEYYLANKVLRLRGHNLDTEFHQIKQSTGFEKGDLSDSQLPRNSAAKFKPLLIIIVIGLILWLLSKYLL